MSLRYSGARWDPLGAQTEAAMLSHDILCLHTMVGSLAGTTSYFKQNGYGGNESHFGVGESKAQGIRQWQDLMFEADANLEGHHRVVSIETADYGGVFGTWNTSTDANVPAWTADQLDMIVGLMVWFCRKATHAGCPSTWKCHQSGVPCVLIPDTKPGRRGIGYHKQGCDPWRVSGGEHWSTAYGKGCPGNRRITQLITIVIPRAAKILAGGVPEEDDVTPEEVYQASLRADRDYGAALWGAPTGTGTALIKTVGAIATVVGALGVKLDNLSKQISNEDVADDTEFRTAMANVSTSLTELDASVDALKAEVEGTPVEPPKV